MPLRNHFGKFFQGGRSANDKDKRDKTVEPDKEHHRLNADTADDRALPHPRPLESSITTTAKDSSLKSLPNEQFNLQQRPTNHSTQLRDSPVVSSPAEDVGSESLWDEAYHALRRDNFKLIDAYERALLEPEDELQKGAKRTLRGGGQMINAQGENREVQLQALVDSKLQGIEKSRMTVSVGGKDVVVKDQVRKIVHAIISAKDFIGTAVSSEPHAALAWAGVLIVLPILLNPVTQDDDAMEGLTYISDFLVRWKVTEDTYLRPSPTVAFQTSQALRNLKISFKAKTVKLYTQILKYQIQVAQQYSRSGLFRVLRDFVIADEWNAMLENLKQLEKDITQDLDAFDSSTLKVVHDKVSELQDQAQKSLILLIETKAGIENSNQNQLLGRLPRAEYAAFNTFKKNESPPPQCLENTRRDIINQIGVWGESHGNDCIFWLNGLAGTGKSTIARTIAHRFHERGRLGASFFFSKGKKDLGDANVFFTTLAIQLTEVVPDLKSYVYDAIAKHGDIAQQPLVNQWKSLILNPLLMLDRSIFTPFVLVFVFDAMDECEGDDSIPLILRLLTEVNDLKVVRIRVFITSRPETAIRFGFRDIPEVVHLDLMLHSIPQSVIEHDISIFCRHELLNISKKRSLEKEWPGEEVIQKLVQKSGRLFIYAATACRFLNKSKYPEKRIAEILQVNSASHSSTKELDEMYTMVLRNLIIDGHDEDNEDATRLFRQIVGAIIVLFDTLSVTSLTRLLAIFPTDMKETLDLLHSVWNIPDDETSPIQLFHLSFREFLLDRKECLSPQFWINEKKAHYDLFVRALKVMSEHLKMDMCNLRLPGALTVEINVEKVEECLPRDVQYACCYWVRHFQQGNIELGDNDQIHEFLKEHFLHWLEALSLIGKVSEAVHMMTDLSRHPSILSSTKHTDLKATVHDARRFILSYKSIIEITPLQIYISPLVFSPTNSIIKNLFLKQLPTWVEGLPIVENDWSPSLQTLEGHKSHVNGVAFSPDGRILASASSDKTIKLWEPSTGVLHSTLEAHSGSVFGVAFSPDGQLFASASEDKTVELWNPKTGASQGTLHGHTEWVWSVAFSPDGKVLASASDDKTIRLWDPNTAASLGILEGHSGKISAVSFSPNNQLLASVSNDRTVRLWDLKTKVLYATLEGHLGFVEAVAFSPNGQLLASGSCDNMVRLWNPMTGASRGTLEGHEERVEAVVFSLDNKLLISGSWDNTIRLWDPVTKTPHGTLGGYAGWVTELAFSPDGQLLASASSNSIQLYDPTMTTLCSTLDSHLDSIEAIVFSPDGQFLASASKDKTIRLWDSTTGASLGTLKGHSRQVRAIAFSLDCEVLASVSWDQTVRLWDPTTRTSLGILEGHSDGVTIVKFSPDGQILASASIDGMIKLWDPKTRASYGDLTYTESSSMVFAIAFSPDSLLLASGSNDRIVRIWNLKTKSLHRSLKGHVAPTMAVDFSPNGQLLASASIDETIKLWDPKLGTLHSTLHGHSNYVTAVAFSPDSQILASASEDNTVRLWDIKTQQAIWKIETAISVVELSFSRDGSHLKTDRGIIELKFPNPREFRPTFNPPLPLYVDQQWVAWRTENVLWLPPDYRANNVAIQHNILALGHPSGRVTFIKLNVDDIPSRESH